MISTANAEEINVQFDRTGKPIEITVNMYSSDRGVQRAFARDTGASRATARKREGFATWNEGRNNDGTPVEPKDLKCVIHVQAPNEMNDEHVLQLGHELLHCLYGAYHDEKQ